MRHVDSRQQGLMSDTRQIWRESYHTVDKITLQRGASYVVFSKEDDPESFAEISVELNPFAQLQRAFSLQNHRSLIPGFRDPAPSQEAGRITYFASGEVLFYVRLIYFSPTLRTYHIAEIALYIDGRQAVVLLDSSGRVGGFADANMNFDRFFD